MSIPRTPKRKIKGGGGSIFVSRLTSDGKYLLTGGQDRTIKLWNPYRTDPESNTNETVDQMLMIKSYSNGHGYEIRDIEISHDKSKFASCGGDKMAMIWDVSTGDLRKLPAHESRINACASNTDFTVLFTGSYDSTVKAWDLRAHSRMPIQTLEGNKDSVTSVLLVPGGSEVITGCVDGYVRTYDLRAGMMHEDNLYEPVTCVSISYDGNCLLSSTLGNAAIRLLERRTGSQLNLYQGHVNTAYPLQSCFSNNDALIISGSEDGDVCIWDLVSAKLVNRIKYHKKPVCSIAYHPKDSMMITSSHDGSAVMFT